MARASARRFMLTPRERAVGGPSAGEPSSHTSGVKGDATWGYGASPPRKTQRKEAGAMTDRRSCVAWLGSLPAITRYRSPPPAPPVVIEAVPTVLYQQPDGRNNLVRITVTGLEAPAARARVTDRRGRLVGTAGILPTGGGGGGGFAGEVWVPLSGPSEFQIELEVGKQRVARRTVRLTPPRRWSLYWLSRNHTAIGDTDLPARCLEVHRKNLDAAP